MKATSTIMLALVAGVKAQGISSASGPLDLGIGDQCDDTKKAVTKLAKQLLPENRKNLKGQFPDKCLTEDKVLSYTTGEYHQTLQSCYYNDKQKPLNEGQIRYFTMPSKTQQYDPKIQPNLLKEISKHKNEFSIKRIGPDFVAVSKSAPANTQQVFKKFDPAGMRFDRPETVANTMEFLFLSGEGEVPDLDRALYALSAETSFTEFLKQNKLNAPFEIPTEIVKVAVENDTNLNSKQKVSFLLQLDASGDKLNIGKGADSIGKAVRAAIQSINDECPSKTGGLPMRQKTLTETSLYFPMQWRLNAVIDQSTQKKDEL